VQDLNAFSGAVNGLQLAKYHIQRAYEDYTTPSGSFSDANRNRYYGSMAKVERLEEIIRKCRVKYGWTESDAVKDKIEYEITPKEWAMSGYEDDKSTHRRKCNLGWFKSGLAGMKLNEGERLTIVESALSEETFGV